MSRLHIHISTGNLDESIEFYSSMFKVSPGVVRDDYASWRLEDPALNLEISLDGGSAGINHLGIHAQSKEELVSILGESAPAASCCGSGSSDYWLIDAQGIKWERVMDPVSTGVFSIEANPAPVAACCVPVAKSDASDEGRCCVVGDAKRGEGPAPVKGGCC